MLKRLFLSTVLVLVLWGNVIPSWAACKQTCDEHTEVCEVVCPKEGTPGSEGKPGTSGGSSSGGTRECRFNDRKIACSSDYGTWVPSVSSWCQRATPQPAKSDPIWSGNTDGYIYQCTRPRGDLIPDPGQRYYRWLPDTEATPPDPEELAREILASLKLDAPDMGMFPKGDSKERMGIVGWHMWLWSEALKDNQWGPVSASRSESGITVTVTAEVDEVVWEMGDGGSVRCGKATAWSSSRTNGGQNVASPDCGYVYEAMGRYTVTTTAHWAVEWSGAGESGTMSLDVTREAPMRVGEIQSVIVANR